ncbi:unnamed protein product [Tuber aestivum]|uniref:Ubiquinol-cytochrome-c reductase complex assembly factor 2 n=1 Tax=Tuber aestivum TaxID=59557 RepID=A0A292PXH9_9PEZI|nr:unnamed protein product [Tuber aestivum]
MALRSALQKQYMTLLSHWPADPLRPNLSFPDTLRRRVEQELGTPHPPESSPQTPTNTDAKEVGVGSKFDEGYEKRQLNALSSLLEDRYKKMYPITDRILMPKSQPDYYKKLLDELDVAPKRSWLEGQLNSWKGWIRLR